MTIKGLVIISIVFFSNNICFAQTPAELVKEGKYEEAIEAYHKAIEESKDNMAKAVLYKELGDFFVSRGNFKNAGGEFVNALSLSRKFSESDRLQMAIYMSWGERLNEAMIELKAILGETPGNLKAHIALARVLSWAGQLHESTREIDKILMTHPDNKDALLTKANALRWQGHLEKAIIIYLRILEKEEDFDSRLGLTHAYLSAGNMKAAKESRRILKPQYPYQDKDLRQLDLAMGKAINPNFGAGFNYYSDSDDNRAYRYSLASGFWLDHWKFDFNYRHTEAKDNTRDTRAEDFFLKSYTRVTPFLGIGGGVGLVQFKPNPNADSLTWNLNADVNLWNGVAGLTLAREGFIYTAQLIANGIRTTSLILSISQRLTDRISILGAYSFRDYSDDNKANDFLLSPIYTLYTRNPRMKLGYRFRYLNFDRQSRSGYFDPNDFLSNQIFISLSFEKDKFYVTLEPYGGHQSFRRYGDNNSGFFGGGSGVLGLNLSKNIVLEANAEGGNYALGAAAGFSYYLVGFRLQIFL
jgi:tetratricopeptide (TPR) repeat protein